MDWAWVVSAGAFAVAMGATPGPNNMMVAASGANYGFRRTVPHILGITFGFPAMFVVVAFAGQAVIADPVVHGVMKWGGVAYLVWLAWSIATAAPGDGVRAARGRPVSFVKAAAFQWVNPKAWIIVAGALATYTLAGAESAAGSFVLTAIFVVVTLATSVGWTLVGIGAGKALRSPAALRRFNMAMAALLLASLVPIVVDA